MPELMKETPIYQGCVAVVPNPEDLPRLLYTDHGLSREPALRGG